jgi:chaperonin GroEL
MTYENVKFGKDCRDKIIEGINLAANAVACTFGPNGKNAIVRDNGGLLITKDGYHTAMCVNDPDPYVSMGIDIIQDICKKTAYDVGDGTSSSAILAAKLINTFKDYEHPISVMRELKDKVELVINAIKGTVQPCTSKDDFFKIANVSANGDKDVASLVAEAFNQVGENGIVMFEESEEVKDSVEYSQGFRIESGYASSYYINTGKKTCELENVLVYISDTKIEEVKTVLELAKKARDNKQSLLLVAPEYDSEIHVFLNQNKSQLQSCAIYSPNRGAYRQLMLDDMKEIFKNKNNIKKVIVTNKTTTFVDEFEVSDSTIDSIKEFLNNPQLPELDRQFHQKRLANFTGKLATIYVGGFSKLEMKERFDRFEDAVCAVRAAREGGMVVGGGMALFKAVYSNCDGVKDSFDFDDEKSIIEFGDDFISVMKYPAELLGTEISVRIHHSYKGKNPYVEIDSTLEDQGVYEPFLVVKTVLENAISTAALVLTTDVAILNFNNFLMN